jgi:hypothetical protein
MIDQSGVFGVEEEREGVVEALLMGDQAYEAIVEFAEKINPPPSMQMLNSDLYA